MKKKNDPILSRSELLPSTSRHRPTCQNLRLFIFHGNTGLGVEKMCIINHQNLKSSHWYHQIIIMLSMLISSQVISQVISCRFSFLTSQQQPICFFLHPFSSPAILDLPWGPHKSRTWWHWWTWSWGHGPILTLEMMFGENDIKMQLILESCNWLH